MQPSKEIAGHLTAPLIELADEVVDQARRETVSDNVLPTEASPSIDDAGSLHEPTADAGPLAMDAFPSMALLMSALTAVLAAHRLRGNRHKIIQYWGTSLLPPPDELIVWITGLASNRIVREQKAAARRDRSSIHGPPDSRSTT